MGFRSDKTLANSSLRKCLGQLLYLKNLAKVCFINCSHTTCSSQATVPKIFAENVGSLRCYNPVA